MAQVPYRANLISKAFPLLNYNGPNTVVVGGADQVYPRYPVSAGYPIKQELDLETPGSIFMQNVLPKLEGYMAVNNTVVGTDVGNTTSASILVRKKINVAAQNSTPVEIYELSNGTFARLDSFPSSYKTRVGVMTGETVGNYSQSAVTYAQVNGKSYAFFYAEQVPANNRYVSIHFDGTSWDNIAPTGLNVLTTRGIVGSSGYVIAYSKTDIAWCSTFDPTDFVPSLITGAGGGTVQEAKGNILFCTPTSFGFIIYCEQNCVAAVATGNSRYPFKLQEIRNAGGGTSIELVAYDADSNEQVAYTVFGIQKINSVNAVAYLPQLTDFIRNGKINSYDSTARTLTIKDNTLPNFGATPARTVALGGKLTIINARYICYSYADVSSAVNIADNQTYTHLLIYDLALERWGHLKVDHVDCFASVNDTYTSFRSISIVQASFVSEAISQYPIYTVDNRANYKSVIPGDDTTYGSALLLGKYKYVRSHWLVIDKVWLESNIFSFAMPRVFEISTLDGKTYQGAVEGYYLSNVLNQPQVVLFSAEAFNHMLLITGNFDLTSLQLDYHPTARNT